MIELAFDGVREEPPLAINGIRLTVRPASGRTPAVTFVPRQTEPAACTITGGLLSISGVPLTVGRGLAADGSVFVLRHAATLDCHDVELKLSGTSGVPEPWSDFQSIGEPRRAFVRVGGHDDADTRHAKPCEVRMTGCLVTGAGVFLEALDGSDLDVFWTGGECAIAGHFLVAEGAPRSTGAGPAIRLSLKEALLACREGFASLRDSPARPLVPQMHAFAEACRFVTPEGRPLLEQSGIEEPDSYRPRIEWLDANSRYQGSSVFRRIDGSAERVEMDFAASPQPLVHSSRILPDVKAWAEGGEGNGEADSFGR